MFDKGGDFYKGFRASVPAGLGVLTYGLVFGVLCAETGLSLPVLALMNVAVFSGSAQALIVGMWNGEFPVWQMAGGRGRSQRALLPADRGGCAAYGAARLAGQGMASALGDRRELGGHDGGVEEETR